MVKLEISLFFPAYNEEENIEQVVLNALTVLKNISSDFEIIVVDDGSIDKTGKIADDLSEKYPEILVIHHSENKGYGAALRSGYSSASKEFIFFTDSDGQFDINDINKFLPYIKDFDIVTGYRIKRRDPLIRTLNAAGWNLINRILFGFKVKDINCAFKCVNRKVFNLFTLTTDGAMINAELYAKAKLHNIKIKEVGVTHYPRQAGTQTGANLTVIIKAFKELYRIRQLL